MKTNLQILSEYIENNYKNVRQFCLAYDINQGNISSILNGVRVFDIKAAKNIEDKIFTKTGIRIFSAKDEELEPDTFRIPEYNVRLSAGHGEEVIHPENIKRYHTFNESFLTDFRVKKDNLAIVQVVGDSMHSTLLSGELVVIDLSKKDPLDNQVYAITTKNHTWVKRYRITPAGGKWQSDNEEYREYDNPLNNGISVRPVGLVLFSLGRKIN